MLIKDYQFKADFFNYLIKNDYSLYYNNESMGHHIFVHKNYALKFLNLNYTKLNNNYNNIDEFNIDLSYENNNNIFKAEKDIYTNYIIQIINQQNGKFWSKYKNELINNQFIWNHNDNLFYSLLKYENDYNFQLNNETKINILNAEIDNIKSLTDYENFLKRNNILYFIKSIKIDNQKDKIDLLLKIYNEGYISKTTELSMHLYQGGLLIKDMFNNEQSILENFKYIPVIAKDLGIYKINDFFIKKDMMFSVKIDLNQLKQSLINCHNTYVENIINKYVNIYINKNEIEYENITSKDTIEILFYKKNKEQITLTKENFQSDMIGFVNYLNSNIIEFNNKEYDEYMNYIDKYIYEYILNKDVNKINKNKTKKQKI